MSEHLPECDRNRGSLICDCRKLRACEQRVRDDEWANQRSPLWHTDMDRAKRIGHAAGVQAARDAVAALDDPDDGWDRGMGWNKGRYDALAAIDALRGES